MGGAPTTVIFRGVNVDPKTGDALAELAAISGNIYVEPIPGFGSYRNNTASGGTDTGGGHCDLNLEGRSDADARTLETLARSIGFVAYFRPRISPYSGNSYGWQRHLHLIRRDAVDLSDKARWQVGEYDAGRDGLAVPHKDTGSRKYVGVTWASYLKNKTIAVPEEDIMASIDDLRKVIKEELDGRRVKDAADRVLGGIPAGAALSRKASDGSTPRLLDSADGAYIVSILRGLAAKLGVDVDETAIANQLIAGLAPAVSDAVKAAVASGVPTADLADAVVARLGQRLSPPA